MVKFAILGHGTVGSGVAEVFFKNKASHEQKAGCGLELKYILDLRDFPSLPYSNLFTKDFSDIVSDPEVSIVAELMGGLHPAFEYVTACLTAGKSVVTSNKELVAMKGAELLRLARDHGVSFLFEASVGGGIPIIRPLHQCLGANEITDIAGILNGTTNFILTKMIRESYSFEQALALAQKLGYAEKDPSADVDGLDAARKICILASLAFGKHIYPSFVHTEGIRGVSLDDVRLADSAGYAIKLIGRASRQPDGRLNVMVSPALLSKESQLAGVSDVFNGILVRGDATGDVVFYGRGAGKMPTASAVMSDILAAAKEPGAERTLFWVDTGENCVCDWRDTSCGYFLRLQSSDADAAAARALELLGKGRVVTAAGLPEDVRGVLVEPVLESRAVQAIALLREEGVTVASAIRVLDY